MAKKKITNGHEVRCPRFPLDDPKRKRKYRRRWSGPMKGAYDKEAKAWRCERCQRRFRGKGWTISVRRYQSLWGKRYCMACGLIVREIIQKESQSVDNRHLPILEL